MDLVIARAKKRVTQWDLNWETGIPQSRVSLIERGYVVPTQKEKEMIANALGLKVAEIEWPLTNKNLRK
jgi:ribosome-binding protein aMBF1 (putative translation factor)